MPEPADLLKAMLICPSCGSITPYTRQPYLQPEDVETLRVALSATEYIGGFYDDREPDPYVLAFRRECCDATPLLRGIIEKVSK